MRFFLVYLQTNMRNLNRIAESNFMFSEEGLTRNEILSVWDLLRYKISFVQTIFYVRLFAIK